MPLNETTSALFRKRSSSLPRILPPILDHDGQEDDESLTNFEDPKYNSEAGGRLAALKQMDQTSNLIVREMQKFVCRHASDVSQVLPLPLPANSRQQSRIQSGNKSQSGQGNFSGLFLSSLLWKLSPEKSWKVLSKNIGMISWKLHISPNIDLRGMI